MAAALGDLVAGLGVAPAMLVGHSAGAAIVARMALDGAPSRAPVVALNGALLPLPGVHGQFFGSVGADGGDDAAGAVVLFVAGAGSGSRWNG